MRKVWLDQLERMKYMHAAIQATLHNAHFDSDGLPWVAEDMLGSGKREERRQQKMRDTVETFRFNSKLQDQPGTKSELPEWASRANAWKETVN